MTIRTFTVTCLSRSTIWLLFVVACDSFGDDFITPENQFTLSQTEYYILPQTSTIVDLRSAMQYAFTDASLTISKPPAHGVVVQIDTLLLKYKPYQTFNQGTDQFVLSVVLADGSTLKTETISIFMKEKVDDFPCGVFGVEDQIRRRRNEVFTIDPVKNDQVCGVKGLTHVSIHLKPKFGNADVVADSIVYRPGPDFTGTDEIVYRLASDGDRHVAYGIISLIERKTEILTLDDYSPVYPNKIFFVNDTVGFVSGIYSVYKTNDGGRHWNRLITTDGGNNGFGEIYFLDEDHGFVSLRSCDADDCNRGGWLMTMDGGTSWVRTTIGQYVKSIFFTSQLTGFVVTEEFIEQSAIYTILKTTDGGKTWNEIFRPSPGKGELTARFVNDQIGYAHDRYTIFMTTDGGESWRASASSNHISSIAITGNVAYAGFSSVGWPGITSTSPSYVVRSDDGVTWTRVKDFSHPTSQVGFSPQGDLGVVVGHSWVSDPSVKSFYHISTSTDKGENWVDSVEEWPGYSLDISAPSKNVVYVLGISFPSATDPMEFQSFIIKYIP
jgi:photosystem II stability/assembly factor-like uncharacterized protein